MVKWYYWLVLMGAELLIGLIGYFDGKSILPQLYGTGFAAVMLLLQLICGRFGETGKKVYRWIVGAVCVLLAGLIVLGIIRIRNG